MSTPITDEVPNTRGRFFSPMRILYFLASVLLPVVVVTDIKAPAESHLGVQPYGVFGLVPLLIGLTELISILGLVVWIGATSYGEPGKPYVTEKTNSIYTFSYMGAVENDVRNKVVILLSGPVGIMATGLSLRGASQVFVSFAWLAFTGGLVQRIYAWTAHYAGYLKSIPHDSATSAPA